MNSAYRLSALLMGTTLLVAQPFQVSIAAVSVGKLAEEVTVFIQGVNNPDSFGSGVIIGRSGNTYTVLTAGHVVEAADQYTIKTVDGLGYTLKNPRKIAGVDLAVVQFESGSSYTVASLGDSDEVSQTDAVFVAGFPKPGQNITVPIFTITTGAISSIVRRQSQTRDGYAFGYNNETRAGMSGGPVFNSAGKVIAIHGRKEGELGGGTTSGAWLNLGVPINFYKAGGGSTQVASASVDNERRAALEAQQRAQQQAALEAQQRAQQQAALEAQQRAQQQAALEAQQRAQRQAALEAQQRAQQQAALEAQQRAQRQAELEAKQRAQQQASEAQQRAQRQAELEAEARRRAEQQAQQRSMPPQTDTQVMANVRPIDVLVPRSSSTGMSSRQVCEDVRINMIVTKRCRTETIVGNKPGDESASRDSPEAYVNNGNAQAARGSHRSAVDDYNSAIQRNANLALAYFNRGIAHYKLGDTNSAITDFSKAADLFRAQGDTQKYQQTQGILQALTQARS